MAGAEFLVVTTVLASCWPSGDDAAPSRHVLRPDDGPVQGPKHVVLLIKYSTFLLVVFLAPPLTPSYYT
jgi:hypothetical protein